MFIEFKKEPLVVEDIIEDMRMYGYDKEEWRAAVISLVLDKDGRILLQRRGPKSRDEFNKLEDIGGAYEESDKNFREAMKREIVEEVGEFANININKYVGACLVNKFDSRTNKNINWFFLLYECIYDGGELLINEPGKCTGYEFYKYDELPVIEVAETTLKFWEYYYKNKKDA